MSSRLVPCSACSRHVRANAERCPFCAAPVSALLEPTPSVPTGRLGSLALMTFRAATLGVAITACGGQSNDPSGQGGQAGAVGAGGNATTGGTSNGAGGTPDTASGGTSSSGDTTGGTVEPGAGGKVDGFGGEGNGVPIYRATPRG